MGKLAASYGIRWVAPTPPPSGSAVGIGLSAGATATELLLPLLRLEAFSLALLACSFIFETLISPVTVLTAM